MHANRSGSYGASASREGCAVLSAASAAGRRMLTEVEAKALLASHGIPVPQGGMVTELAVAEELAERIGYPVVVKGVSASVSHKTEAGLVELGITDRDALCDAYGRVRARGGAELCGVLVERQLPRERELVVGLTRDRQFGPVVMCGLGGVAMEVVDDVAFALAPVTHSEALDLMTSIRSRRVLDEFRGRPAVDRDELARVIEAVSRMAYEHPEIAEIDVNPLLLDGDRPVAADALVVLGGSELLLPSRPPFNAANLTAVYRPASVAVIGASNDPLKWGGTILVNLISGGFKGHLYAVTPQADTVLGLPTYPDVTSLPEAPDMALVAVPLRLVKKVVRDCGEKGVKALVMVTAGFSEMGEEGRDLEREITELAAGYGMVLVGPNCMGVVSSRHNLCAVGALHLRPTPGPAGFVSQSGNVAVQMMVSAEQRGGGIGSFVGVGNEALVDTADILDYLREDPHTQCALAYIEGCDDGRRLMRSAREFARSKPLVTLRAAVSEYGSRAAASHTGALAGSRRIFEGAARQAGMLVTFDPDEFLDLAMAFSYLPLPRGRRVGIVTMGGGWGVLCADEVERSGLELARFDPSLLERLDGHLPPYWSRANPVDLVATIKEGVAEAVVEAIIASEQVDVLVVSAVVSVFGLAAGVLAEARRLHESGAVDLAQVEMTETEVFARRRESFVKHLAHLMETYDKPIISVAAVPVGQSVFTEWGRYGVVVIQSPLRAVRVLSYLARYAEWKARRNGEGASR